ncbi:hypothetical protein [Deinococcus navajonensis]|uniref:Lipoprotein n=1 Tax=Deinococcus navajonensis TaxID=309884 RepID=A0ABV8XKI4_9DEIO
MRKSFQLPLLSSLPALLLACGDRDDLGRYNRVQYSSYEQCMQANRAAVQQGLSNPCQKSGRAAYGPYIRYLGASTRYVGYTASGGVATSGLNYDKQGRVSSFKAPGVSRGGFTSSARSGGSFGG